MQRKSMANIVPSVYITFRHPVDPLNPINHKKTPQFAKVAPASVMFPSGHASFPAVGPQALVFSKAIQSFTESLSEILATSTQEESTQPSPPPEVTPETAKTLKQAFELLQAQLQEGVHLFPETKQPLPKALLQVLVQTPVFIEQLRELLQKSSVKQPILEEAEVLVKLPLAASKLELKALEELQRNIPSFVKTLQAALTSLPPALPPAIKEALERYLRSPVVQSTLPQAFLLGKEPLLQRSAEEEIKPPILQKQVTPLQETPLLPKPISKEAKEITPLLQKQPLLEEKVLPSLLAVTQPKVPLQAKIQTNPLGQPLIAQEPVVKKGGHPHLIKAPLQPVEAERPPPLAKLPEVAIKEALEGFYPLMKTLLGLLQKEKFIPTELVALLKQMPLLIEQLKQLFAKEPSLLTAEEKEILKALQRSLPSLLGNLKVEVSNLPKFLFPEIRGELEAYVNNFPLEELAIFLRKRTKLHLKVAHPVLGEIIGETKGPIEQEKVKRPTSLVETPLTSPFENEGVLGENVRTEGVEIPFEKLEETSENLLAEEVETEGKTKGSKIESPKTLPLFTVEQFKEHMKVPNQPPEFSTEIPFAFIVPYVPNTPIHTPAPDVKITSHDPMKEELKEDNSDRKKKTVQMFSYIPAGEAWVGDPVVEGDLRKSLLPSYAIGVYLVTNQQFADFLRKQSKLKEIYVKEGGVFSKDKGFLLCQLKSCNSASDIEPEPQENYLSFKVTEEKDSYPVVCVTYHGAKAFCVAGGFRLPTETEWEKAASLEMTEDNIVKKKFLFGCSRDEITTAFANYNTDPSSSIDIFTTPVGYYNGKTSFMKEGIRIQTFDAKSPFGCYDMSGNVWEWIEGSGGHYAPLKGGCFLSKEDDLRVSQKKEKAANSLDGYTGFRVALS